jgi:hypothetical protein
LITWEREVKELETRHEKIAELRDASRQKRKREASKPLYLTRYE